MLVTNYNVIIIGQRFIIARNYKLLDEYRGVDVVVVTVLEKLPSISLLKLAAGKIKYIFKCNNRYLCIQELDALSYASVKTYM